MISIDVGNGFRAVPRDAVTLNGLPLPQLNTQCEPYQGTWHLIAPNNRAIDNVYGRPYLYQTLEELRLDAARLAVAKDYSTC